MRRVLQNNGIDEKFMAIFKVKEGTGLSRCLPTNQRSCSEQRVQYLFQLLPSSSIFLDDILINGNTA